MMAVCLFPQEKPRRVRAGHGDILTNSYVLTFVAFAIDEMGSPPGEGRADGVYRKRAAGPPLPGGALNAVLTQRNAPQSVPRCYKKSPPVRAQCPIGIRVK